MAKINILPPKVYNRIAAGEVVDRPYSVVKELVENAIDAGATEIEISIEKGGKQLIRVVDNGCGIARDDLQSAFLPHATSKIAQAEDLENILTLGFRGEAVASIASVSRMTITSKTADGECYSLTSEGGELGQILQAAGENGTDVSVENLFIYNGLVNITGGNAGNGGNGGNGGKGSSWLLSYEYGQSGNDGGYGGNGGNAGLSGCGVVATTSVYIYGGHNVIKGGDGGAGGNGGNGGNGGRCGNPEATTPHEGGKGGNGGNGGSNSHAGEGITSPKVIIAGGETMVWGGNSNPVGSAGICGSNGYGRNPGYPLNGSAGTCYGFGGAGINADLIISGGLVKTTGGTYASALGGSGYTSNKNGKAITVTGGKVIVQAGDKGFDIGGEVWYPLLAVRRQYVGS